MLLEYRKKGKARERGDSSISIQSDPEKWMSV
jgi:hypothetical protein